MGFQPRVLEKFESSDGVTSLVFSLGEYEMESQQGYRGNYMPGVGLNYGFNALRNAAPVRDFARESLRFVIYEEDPATVDTTEDSIRSILGTVGRGKLFSIDKNDVRRWSWASPQSAPSISWRAGMIFSKGISLDFMRESDWFASALTTDSRTITASPTAFTLTNPGNVAATLMTIRIRANAWATNLLAKANPDPILAGTFITGTGPTRTDLGGGKYRLYGGTGATAILRMNMNEADLVDNADHTASIYFENAGAGVTMDLADISDQPFPGTSGRHVVTGARVFDATYRFVDIAIPAGVSIDVWSAQVELGSSATAYNAYPSPTTHFTNPKLENLTNGYIVGSLRDSASANDEVRIDTEKKSIEYSVNDGLSYSNDFANRVIGSRQAEWMKLQPGANNMRVTCDGEINFDLSFEWYAPYA